MHNEFDSVKQVFNTLFTVCDVIDTVASSNGTMGEWGTSGGYSTITYSSDDYKVSDVCPGYLQDFFSGKEKICVEDLWKNLRKDINSFNFIRSSSGAFPFINLKINKKTKDLFIEMALAGYSKEEIEVVFEDDLLFVKSVKHKKEEQKNEGKEEFFVIKNNIKQSAFDVTFNIPFEKYDIDNSKVVLGNGILKIDIPAKEEARPKIKRVEIN